ncbi:MAG TPA: hypothetical protein VHV29_16905 [Terriglobales bacterium]|jgi:iron complex transport system ATP-binding protein|nr:hypothetical protein [Terriglobales bacterium]
MKKVRDFASRPDVVVIGVVHDLNLALRFADRLVLLYHGRILADGAPVDVLTADSLRAAFQVVPILVEDASSGKFHLAYE